MATELDPREPSNIRGKHLPGLDGLRALAVMGVVAYHLGFSFASGGFLGVDLFFVLSGFLITSLLVEERASTGGVALAKFWGRRAKRLLPALFVMLAVVLAYVAIVEHRDLFGGLTYDFATLRGDAFATIFYVANWHLILTSQSYFSQFAQPSPLQHTWSLAIEEQYYLVFPLVAIGLLALRRSWRRTASVLLLLLAAASIIEMAVLFHAGADPTRIYYGTDTRAFDLLIGSAMGFATAANTPINDRLGRVIELAAWPAGLLLGVFWIEAGTVGELPRDFMYRGGFALCSLLAALVILAVAQRPGASITKVLSLRPLVAIGVVSYGVYLWHWPIILLINGHATGLGRAPLDVLRIALIALFTCASYFLIERPVRRHRWTRIQSIVALPGAFVAVCLVALLFTSSTIFEPAAIPNEVATFPVVGVGPDHVIPGSGGSEGQVPITIDHQVSRRDPLRVLLIGDSVIQEAASGLRSALASTNQAIGTNLGFPGWGLTVKSLKPFSLLQNSKAYAEPDVVVASWGWDNAFAAAHPAEYRAMLRRAVTILTTGPHHAAGIIFLTQPVPGPTPWFYTQSFRQNLGSPANIAAWEDDVRFVEHEMPGKVMLLPISSSVSLPNGSYSTWLPPGNAPAAPYQKWVRVRKTDGVHLCQNGVIRYGTALLSDLHDLFGLGPSTTSWWLEPWVNSSAYSTTGQNAMLDSTCPGDHPPKGTSLLDPAAPSS